MSTQILDFLTLTIPQPVVTAGRKTLATVTRSGGSTTGYSSTQTGTIEINFQTPGSRTFTVTGATIGDPVTVNVTGSNFIGEGTACAVTGPDGVRRTIWVRNGPIGTSRTETVAYPIESEVNGTWIIELFDNSSRVHTWDSATLTIGTSINTATDALPITLTSSETGVATVPATVTIPQNQPCVSFLLDGVAAGISDISATYGNASSTKPVGVVVDNVPTAAENALATAQKILASRVTSTDNDNGTWTLNFFADDGTTILHSVIYNPTTGARQVAT